MDHLSEDIPSLCPEGKLLNLHPDADTLSQHMGDPPPGVGGGFRLVVFPQGSVESCKKNIDMHFPFEYCSKYFTCFARLSLGRITLFKSTSLTLFDK